MNETITVGWTQQPANLDAAGQRNLPRVNRLIDDLFADLDPQALSRKGMAGRFRTVAQNLGAGSLDRYTAGPLVLRASATTWAYVATIQRNDEPVATLEVSGVL
ncbi:hypothetical protein OIV56_13630 [Burkholderia pseudomallei]|uniref:hypothetical protein n=1 Tax=Burkholderia pseudomallei TaxID=28450 RepID=UPI0021F6F714|nr:hypothetical protein [Burkholderia pseudomallei]MCW0163767.1 hypothetical protein [Burkholderia pseudomallei]